MKKDNFSLKDFFKALNRFKYSILFFIIVSTLVAFLYQYYQQNIYRAKAIVEISSTPLVSSRGADILNSAFSNISNIKTEMEVLKSKSVNSLALKKVDFMHRYYAYLEERNISKKNSLGAKVKNLISKYKKVDIYDKTPFKIVLSKGYDIPFTIFPLNNNRFLLKIKDKSKNLNYSHIYEYNKTINTPLFSFKLIKLKEPKYKKYLILVKNPKTLVDDIRQKLIVLRTDLTSNSVKIEFEDTIPNRAKDYVNAVANAYIKQNIEFKTKEASKKLAFIRKQLSQITKKLQSSTKKLEKYQTTNNIVDLNQKASILIQKSSQLKSELEKLELRKKLLSLLFKKIKKGGSIDDIAITSLDNENPVLNNLIAKLQQAMIEKSSLLTDYTIYHPYVIKQDRIISKLKKAIYKNIKNSINITNNKIATLKKLLKKYNKQLSKLPKQEQQLGALKRNYLVSEKLYNYLLEKEAEISLIKESTLSNTRIIDYASSDLKPIKPKRKLIILMGLIIGFILGVLQAYIRKELNSNKISVDNIKDIENKSNLEVIAQIPHIANLRPYTIALYKDINSKFAEAFRKLRTELRFILKSDDKSKIITVSSYKKGEGKTTIALNLAAILGLAKKKVILIDANLKNGEIAKYSSADESIGLSNYLNDEAEDIIYIIQMNLLKGVDIISCGPKKDNSSELLESKKFQELLDKLKEYYEYIIIDTPSYKDYADAKLLLLYSDLNLFILRENYSDKDIVEKIKEIKYLDKTKIVINDINE